MHTLPQGIVYFAQSVQEEKKKKPAGGEEPLSELNRQG